MGGGCTYTIDFTTKVEKERAHKAHNMLPKR